MASDHSTQSTASNATQEAQEGDGHDATQKHHQDRKDRRPWDLQRLTRDVLGSCSLRALHTLHPEISHRLAIGAMDRLGNAPRMHRLLDACAADHRVVNNPRLEVNVAGLRWRNPIGLAAGFDKSAQACRTLDRLGFGALEIGSVTRYPRSGNTGSRITRITEQRALINRYGLNNDGAEIVRMRLQTARQDPSRGGCLGVSIAATPGHTNATTDVLQSLDLLCDAADYVTVNLSCPNVNANAPDPSQVHTMLRACLERLSLEQRLFAKLSPDMPEDSLRRFLDAIQTAGTHGVVLTNTTATTWNNNSAGLSGPPLREKSLNALRIAKNHLGTQLSIVACGGISTVDDVWERLKLGASAVQIYTAFVYEGPYLVERLARELLLKLSANSIDSVSSITSPSTPSASLST